MCDTFMAGIFSRKKAYGILILRQLLHERKYMDNEELTVRQYADSLEAFGYMALGEPYVHYKIQLGRETIQFYLDFNKHHTQTLIAGGYLRSNPSAMRDAIFNQDKLEARYTLTDFVKEFDTKKLICPKLKDLKKNGRLLGRSTSTKHLTFFLAQSILDQDTMSVSSTIEDQQVTNSKLLSELLKSYESIGRPEQLAYVARLNYFTTKEKIEFVSLPLSYLSSSFEPSDNYSSITLPRESTPRTLRNNITPYARKLVSVS